MYDDFSADYDRFMNWPARLAAEMPFIEGQLQAIGARRVLDVACGTGMHAVALAQRGYSVAGADFSTGMVERARANAATAAPVLSAVEGGEVRFEVAGFGELALAFGSSTPGAASSGRHSPTGFDGLLCLGNSLPHLLTPADLRTAMEDFAACLRPGGLLLIQNRNFDAVLARRGRWMEAPPPSPPLGGMKGGGGGSGMSLPALLRLRARRHADLQPGDIAEGGKRRLEPASCVHTAAPSAAERPESSAGRGRLSGDRLLR